MAEQNNVNGDKGGCTGALKGIPRNRRDTGRRELDGRSERSKQNARRDRTNTFMEGCITKQWKEIQTKYLQSTQSRKNPSRWAKELIKKVWMVSWDMWDTRNGWVHREARIKKQQIGGQLEAEIDRLLYIITPR